MGPTASGKTDLALKLCQAMPCEIISVDSALIYKDMNIGTAKPTQEERAIAPHHLIDIIDPAESYSAANFRTDALKLIDEVKSRGRTPLLVGGTMLYFKVLIEGLSPLPEASPEVRLNIQQDADEKGWDWLHRFLQDIDPVSAQRIHPNDPQRLVRAIEVFKITGQSLTELTKKCEPGLTYPVKQFMILPQDRAWLHNRIEQRFDIMLQQGLEDEVAGLMNRGDLHLDLPSMRCVGYRQMWEYLEGKCNKDEMRFRGIVATRQLAKRQYTWLRSWTDAQQLDVTSDKALDKLISECQTR